MFSRQYKFIVIYLEQGCPISHKNGCCRRRFLFQPSPRHLILFVMVLIEGRNELINWIRCQYARPKKPVPTLALWNMTGHPALEKVWELHLCSFLCFRITWNCAIDAEQDGKKTYLHWNPKGNKWNSKIVRIKNSSAKIKPFPHPIPTKKDFSSINTVSLICKKKKKPQPPSSTHLTTSGSVRKKIQNGPKVFQLTAFK